jgi:hypothetical protein
VGSQFHWVRSLISSCDFFCVSRVHQCLFPVSIQLRAQGFPHQIHVVVFVSRSKSNIFLGAALSPADMKPCVSFQSA